MKTRKTARVEPFIVEVICPHCDELVINPSEGSYMWEVGKINAGELVVCSKCGKKSKLPNEVSHCGL